MQPNFIVVYLIVYLLHMSAVCQAEETATAKTPNTKIYTFEEAVSEWESKDCIFPDVSWYKLKDKSPARLEKCKIFDKDNTPDADIVLKKNLCQKLYQMSISLCQSEKFSSFVQGCLSAAVLEKLSPFKDNNVCFYISEIQSMDFFTFMQGPKQCKDICVDSEDWKDICELYATIFYQFQQKSNCSLLKAVRTTQSTPLPTMLDDASLEKSPIVKLSPESKTEERATSAPSVASWNDGKNTSVPISTKPVSPTDEQNTSVPISKNPVLPMDVQNATDSVFKKPALPTDEQITAAPISQNPSTIMSTSRKPDPTPLQSETTEIPSTTIKLKTTFSSLAHDKSSKDKTITPILTELLPQTEDPDSETVKPETSTLASTSAQIASTSKPIVLPILKSTTLKPDIIDHPNSLATTDIDNQLNDDDSGSNNPIYNNEIGTKDDNAQEDDENSEELTDETDNNADANLNKNRLQSNKDKTNKENDDNKSLKKIDENEKQSHGKGKAAGERSKITDDESPGSGHFLAYFLTAVIICISGYVIYHNKQKILAFIIEGRNSGRNGRQRSKDVKYTQLKSNVEEVLPSLEQMATTKNFVY